MTLSSSIKALLYQMAAEGHGLPDYINRVGRTDLKKIGTNDQWSSPAYKGSRRVIARKGGPD